MTLYNVYNLETEQEYFYEEHIPQRQALKTSYALENGLSTQLATNFGELMEELEKLVVEGRTTYSLGDLITVKHNYRI